MKTKKIITVLCIGLLAFACQDEGIEPQEESMDATKVLSELQTTIKVNNRGTSASRVRNNDDESIQNWMAEFNAAIADQGIQLVKAEFLGFEEAGRTVFFDNKGSKQIGFEWVANDPRNNNFGADVPYWIDNTELGTTSGLSPQETFNSFNNTMETWDAQACSSGLGIPFLGISGGDVGLVQFFEGAGGSPSVITGAILHAGILPAEFFEAIGGPGGGNGILGVTFTFSWGTDNNGDGKGDTALAEIYINDNFNWQDAPNDVLFDAEGVIDLETVVLHEVGHALSQAHFGTAFRDAGGNNLHFSPAALMNAGYTVARRDISATDQAGHCSNWSKWPNE